MQRREFVSSITAASAAAVFGMSRRAGAEDWRRFRGPGGRGIAESGAAPPEKWSDEQNLRWVVELPGPGHSSPIIVGDRVLLTYWSGYGLSRDQPGDPQDLQRHLLCLQRDSGQTLWDRAIDARLPEDEYGGMFAEHGYASHTPASDGQRVFCFFGKSGVFAFDLEGKQLWQTDVGEGLDQRHWGSASSLLLTGDLVVVTAGPESGTIYGLEQSSGTVRWKQDVGLSGMWGTPVLVRVDDGRSDLVLAVPDEVWGLNPATGKLRWYCEGIGGDSVNASPAVEGSVAYVIDGQDGQALAVRAGGKGDVDDSHVLWRESHRGRISTPLAHRGLLYWIHAGVAHCVDGKTGQRVYQERLPLSGGRSPAGRSRRRGGQDYGSPVAAGDRLFYINRQGAAAVIRLGREFEVLATNRFEQADGDFSATPAIADGQLFIRSTRRMYCVG